MDIEKIIHIYENSTLQSTCFTADAVAAAYVEGLSTLYQVKPKTVIEETEPDREFTDYICPNCKNIISQRRKGEKVLYMPQYHDACGQALEWPERSRHES